MNDKLNKLLGTNGINYKKPANFVKLLELKAEDDAPTLWWSINAESYLTCSGLPTTRDEFIEKVINMSQSQRFKPVISQAQKTNWEAEHE